MTSVGKRFFQFYGNFFCIADCDLFWKRIKKISDNSWNSRRESERNGRQRKGKRGRKFIVTWTKRKKCVGVYLRFGGMAHYGSTSPKELELGGCRTWWWRWKDWHQCHLIRARGAHVTQGRHRAAWSQSLGTVIIVNRWKSELDSLEWLSDDADMCVCCINFVCRPQEDAKYYWNLYPAENDVEPWNFASYQLVSCCGCEENKI